MNQPSFLDRIIHTLGFPFRGPGWGTKFLLGYLLCAGNFVVPILPVLFVHGYGLRIMRRVLETGEASLPDWDDWGGLLRDGLRLWGATMTYNLPVLGLMLVGMAGFCGPWFYVILSPSALQYGLPPENSLGILFGGFAAGTAAMCLAMPLGLMLSVVEIPALGHAASRRSFTAAFDFKGWWPVLKASLGSLLLVMLTLYLLTTAFSLVLSLLSMTIVLAFLAPLTYGGYIFLTLLYNHSLAALAYRQGRLNLEQGSA